MKSKKQLYWDDVYAGGKDYNDPSDEQMEILLSNTDTKSSILDIGCGTGRLMEIIESKGIVANGIEVSEVAIIKAKGRGVRGEIVLLDTEEIDGYQDKNKYDKVILKMVISFIKNKINLLVWIKEHLRESGELVIITPVSGADSIFKISDIAINKNELERSLYFVFGNFKVSNELDTPNGKIYTYVCAVK